MIWRPALETEEGVYTITITNKDIENVDPTVKKVYVGTNNILKAYMVNNIPIADIKEMIALGATINEDGTITPPDSGLEPDEDQNTDLITERNHEDNKSDKQAQTNDSIPTILIIIIVAIMLLGVLVIKLFKKKEN